MSEGGDRFPGGGGGRGLAVGGVAGVLETLGEMGRKRLSGPEEMRAGVAGLVEMVFLLAIAVPPVVL